MKASRAVIGIAWLLYAASWFFQVVKDGTTLSHGTLPGWEAFHTALLLDGFEGSRIEGIIWVLSALTNFLMIASPIILLSRLDKLKRLLPWLLVLATILNTQWLILSGMKLAEFRAGYYLWWASFLLLAVASFYLNQRTLRAAKENGIA